MDPRRVREIYDRAAELPSDAARSFLEEACRGEPELLSEVASLLRTTADVGAFLEEPESASRFGDYEVVEPLGHGGQGSVYRARHGLTGALVALKTVRDTTQPLVGSVRREIHTLARMHHERIVRIVDSGVERGAPWYAMELVEGATLRAAMREQPVARLLTAVHRVCDPLAYLHGQGVVHRDLKPSNILLRLDGTPVLVDFGVASELVRGSREALRVEGHVVGTVLYMAPEQVRGELVDARADLYSLGCILYEIFAGRPPFSGRDAGVVLEKHLSAVPRPLRELTPSVPAEVDALVARLLAKEPRDRIGYAVDVAAILEQAGVPPDPRPTRGRSYLYRARHAGRDVPLQELTRRIARAAEGSGGIVLVKGRAGIGKTRFLQEASRHALRREMRVLSGECRPLHAGESVTGAPLHAIAGALEEIVDGCRDAGSAEARRVFGRRAAVLRRYLPSLSSLPGVDGEPEPPALPPVESRLRVYAYLWDALAAAAEGTPVILVLDDLQWADELSLGFLAYLARAPLAGRRFLLLGAYRPEDARAALAAIAAKPGITSVELEVLAPGDVETMVGDMLALEKRLPAIFAPLAASRRNPFFVAESVKTAVWEQLLTRERDGRWRSPEGGGAALPATIAELLDRRLAGLGAPASRTASAAAIVARPFDAGLVAAVAALEEPEALEGIEELLSRQLVEELSGGRLRLVHEKVRDVLTARLPEGDRRRLHRSCADALASVAPPEELAYHREQSGELVQARALYLESARRAVARHAYDEAERHYGNFLGLVPDVSAERVEARLELGTEVLSRQGRRAEAALAVEEALAEAEAIGARASVTRALRSLGYLRHVAGRTAEARELIGRAAAAAREMADPRAERIAVEQLGIVAQEEGNLDEALALQQGALAMSRRAADAGGEGNALANLATLHHQQRDLDAARRLYEEALEVFRRVGDARLQGISTGNLAALHLEQGRLPEAERLYRSALDLAREVGDRWAEALGLGNLGICLYLAGTPGARDLYEQALSVSREVGDGRAEGSVKLSIATLDFDEARFAEARSLCEELLASPTLAADRQLHGATRCLLARIVRSTGGSLDDAATLAREARSLCEEAGDRLETAKCLCELGHVALARGEDARPLLERVAAIVSELGVGPDSELGRFHADLRRAIDAR